ncbi:hypothetical protein SESBI_00678 [Sesbania bispinosa]|nr:hypothetical protein SESBI_00678 [Sesbania bispinosa]
MCFNERYITFKSSKDSLKFVSADNGASQIINAYLHRASASFNELDQLHKELKLSRSHKKRKHKRHGTETGDEENFAQIVETNQELSHGNVKSMTEFRRQGVGSENTDEDDKKSTQNVVKVLRCEVENPEGEVAKGQEQNKVEKRLTISCGG